MANTLTNLIPDIYAALDVVSRELVGFIPAVTRDSTADRVAINQNLRIPVAPSNTAGGDITPAMAFPSRADQTIGYKTLTITKQRFYPFSWTNEERYSVDQGPGAMTINQYQIAQAVRGLVNEMELDIANAANLGASRATGTAGTTPFASTVADSANLRKILDDNGAPASDRHLIIDTAAGAKLRTLTQLTKANEAGTSSVLTDGTLINLAGFSIRESAQVPTSTAGAMASATSTSAAFTVGQTVIPLATAGTGVVAAGDIITFANDANQYVIASVSFAGSNPASGDSITLVAPGLRKAQGVATRAITVVAAATRNVGFSRNALLLATRLPVTDNDDIARFRETITDGLSGISLEFVKWPGQDMSTYHVRACWGVLNVKPEHTALLLG